MPATTRRAIDRKQWKAVRAAFEIVCDALDLPRGREDRLAEDVARRLIDLAAAGECDPGKLSAIALAEFGVANNGSLLPH